MNDISILNDVLGPVMRGPSSSHTAASYHLGALARSLLGAKPTKAELLFDPDGSYAKCYRQQGSDLAFAAGLLGWSITDERFRRTLELAPEEGLQISFGLAPLEGATHPNTVSMRVEGEGGGKLDLVGRSIGGGAVQITRVDGWAVRLDGNTHEVLVETAPATSEDVLKALERTELISEPARVENGSGILLVARAARSLSESERREMAALSGVRSLRLGTPLAFVKRGRPLLRSAADLEALATEHGVSAGEVALRHEASLLGVEPEALVREMDARLRVMEQSVEGGLDPHLVGLQLLDPTASKVFEFAERRPQGRLHTRAAARSMAVMHQNGSMGVVCAAPTAGSAGVIPAVAVTLLDDLEVPREDVIRGLFAAGAIGVIVAERATFAAEVAGCQVEIGAAGAMAAAAVVEAYGGSAAHACHAAAISFQNTMGSVCDLVQGMVEVPCHTRNAVAASAAFVTSDLVLGGYVNPIPLDETVDAVYAVGKMMPSQLRCTSMGGIAATPTAQCLRKGCGQ